MVTGRSSRDGGMLRRGFVTFAAALPLLAACAVSPEQRAATEKAWAERDAEWAKECTARGGRYISSSCVGFGGP